METNESICTAVVRLGDYRITLDVKDRYINETTKALEEITGKKLLEMRGKDHEFEVALSRFTRSLKKKIKYFVNNINEFNNTNKGVDFQHQLLRYGIASGDIEIYDRVQ